MSIQLFFLVILEIIKLQLIASYGFLALGRILARPLPFLASSLAFLVSVALEKELRRASLRFYLHLLVNLIGFALSFALVFALRAGISPTPAAVAAVFSADPLSGMAVLAALAVFWLRGVWLQAQPFSHDFVVARFDEGLALFFAALILQAVARVSNPRAGELALPDLVFSVLALGVSRRGSERRGGFAQPKRGTVAVAQTVVFALSAYGLASLMPALGEPAAKAAYTLGALGSRLLRWIEIFLVWLFKPRGKSLAQAVEGGVRSAAESVPIVEEAHSLFSTILLWLVGTVAAVIVLILTAWLLYGLAKFLFARVPASAGTPPSLGLWKRFKAFLARIARALGKMSLRRGRRRNFSPALSAYARLLSCGRAAGLPRMYSETPREFSGRLAEAYPGWAEAADIVTSCLEAEVYGKRPSSGTLRANLEHARGRLQPLGFLLARLARGLTRMRGKRSPTTVI
ncbi:MAG: DUF4129 domain-containing protein [Spirochaetes bacterium]|nr:DUF4129 domain-containing protein [Spirochaetota bacterium]